MVAPTLVDSISQPSTSATLLKDWDILIQNMNNKLIALDIQQAQNRPYQPQNQGYQ